MADRMMTSSMTSRDPVMT